MLNIGFIYGILKGSTASFDIPKAGGLKIKIYNGESLDIVAPDYKINISGTINTNKITGNTIIKLRYRSNDIEFRGREIKTIEIKKSKILNIPEIYYGTEKITNYNIKQVLGSIFGRTFINKYYKEIFK